MMMMMILLFVVLFDFGVTLFTGTSEISVSFGHCNLGNRKNLVT
jgi:hypothetical protein